MSQLEKLLPTQAVSEDQREVLRLLCRAHELEVENTELRADKLCRGSLLRQKDLVIQRHHQHRLLCERLIQDLWQLVQGEAAALVPVKQSPSLPGRRGRPSLAFTPALSPCPVPCPCLLPLSPAPVPCPVPGPIPSPCPPSSSPSLSATLSPTPASCPVPSPCPWV